MNVSDARFSAIWCAATCTTPSQPISSAMTLNAPPSSIICAPIGSPSFSMRISGRKIEQIRRDVAQVRMQRPPAEREHQHGHEPAAHGRRPRGADHAHRRKTEVAVDPRVVQRDVDEIRDDDRDDDRQHAVVRLQRLAQHDEHVERPHRQRVAVHVARRIGNHLGRLVDELEHGPHGQAARARSARSTRATARDRAASRGARRARRARRAPAQRSDRARTARPCRRSRSRRNTCCRARPTRAPRATPAHHDGVDDAHQHRADLNQHERTREAQQRAKVGAGRLVLEREERHGGQPEEPRSKSCAQLGSQARPVVVREPALGLCSTSCAQIGWRQRPSFL